MPSRHTSIQAVFTGGLALLASSIALANQEAIRLTDTVVTASGFEQKITDAPASISVISQEDLQRNRYSNLAQALETVEGVDIGQGTGKTGGLNISIRGMPSAYTLILIDGRRQNNSGDITPNGFGETSTSFMPPLSAIERIEVIRGPMSTLYGSDAMGGVVNIITKKVGSEWAGSVTIDHTIQENRDYGETSNASIYASGPLIENLLGLQVRGSVLNRSASDLEFSDGTTISRRGGSAVEGRNTNFGGRLTLTPHENHDVSLDFERGRQVYDNDDCQLGTLDGFGGNATAGCTTPNTTAAGYADELRFERDQFALSHTARLGFGTLDSSLTHKVSETIGRTVPGTIGTAWTNFPTIVGGADRKLKSTDLVFDTKLTAAVGDAHIVTIGGQYLDAEIKDGVSLDTFEQSSWALFVEDEWRLRDDLALTLGARYEDHDAFGGHVSPRAYLVWNTNDSWTLKGGVSRGYKTPTPNQLHNGINGATAQGATITIGNPNLEPEVSTNYEFGVYYDNFAGFNANATLFHTKFKDVIVSGAGAPIPNCQVNPLPNCLDFGSGFTQPNFAQADNIGKAETEGLELAARWQFAPSWRLSGNYTFTDTEQKSGDDKGASLTNTPKHLLNASLNWNTTERLELWLKGEYRGKRDRFTSTYANLANANGSYSTDQSIYDTLGKTKAYTLFHLGGSFQASDKVTLNATIYNLLDKDFLKERPYTTYSYNNQGVLTTGTSYGTDYAHFGQSTLGTIQEGRRLWLSATIDF